MADPIRWLKSSFSTGGGECVEVAILNDVSVAARDGKAPGGGVLVFPRAGFASLVRNLASD